MRIIVNMSQNPLAGFMLVTLLFALSFLTNHSLLDSLLKMHRSKTAVKRIKSEYRISQRIWLIPYEVHCIHATKFSGCMVWLQRIRMLFYAVYLVVAILIALGYPINILFAWFTLGMLICFDIPSFLVHIVLSRPIFGKFREYSFEKYHNTKDHSSLL